MTYNTLEDKVGGKWPYSKPYGPKIYETSLKAEEPYMIKSTYKGSKYE